MSEDLIVGHCVIPARDLSWSSVRSSGPGGQNVNKVSTKVVLRFDLEGSSALTPGAKSRLRALAKNRLDPEGFLILSSQETRSLTTNLSLARKRLADLIASALERPKRRQKTRPSRAANARRITEKRKQGSKKRLRTEGPSDD